MTHIDELEMAMQVALREWAFVKGVVSEHIEDAVQLARDKATEESQSLYGGRLDEAIKAVSSSKKSYLDAVEQNALAGKGAKFTLGTVLEEWGRENAFDRHSRLIRTGRRAIYEAVTRESLFSSSLTSYSRPKSGSFILRLLKKDGSVGLQVIKSYAVSKWHPEGVDPNEKRWSDEQLPRL